MLTLALELGKSIYEIEQMPSRDLSEWIAYSKSEPIGREQRADLRAGITTAVIANSHRASGRAYIAQDFMPFPQSKPVSVSPVEAVQEFKRKLKALKNG